MANSKHLNILKQGVTVWNEWRTNNPDICPDLTKAILREADLTHALLYKADLTAATLTRASLREADLTKACLIQARLFGATLTKATLTEANLTMANLTKATLTQATLTQATLREANLTAADLAKTDLFEANLTKADLTAADLRGSDLQRALLVQANLKGANLKNCRIYGNSVWNLVVDGETQQSDLIITPRNEPTITVDNLSVAQFVYLHLNNQNIRHLIDTMNSKVVLILARSTPERKVILDAIREKLRGYDYLPVLFDFEKPTSQDVTGTVELLARMARFIIADLSEASRIPHDLATVVPFLRTTPVVPLRMTGARGYSLCDDLESYSWVLGTYNYDSAERLISVLGEKVILPAEAKVKELAGKAKNP